MVLENLRPIPLFAIDFLRGGGSEALQARAAQIEQEELDKLARRGLKIPKVEAWYSPFPPPPAGYLYDCLHCRFFEPPAGPGAPNTCTIVGRPGDPWGGEAISPFAWCGLWLPVRGEELFTWLVRWADPRQVIASVETTL